MDAGFADIKAVVGSQGWLDDASAIEPHLVESRGLFQGETQGVVRPASTEELSRVVTLAHQRGIAIVPQGGNTGLCGGGVPLAEYPNIVISLSRMNKVRSVDAVNYTMVVEAGCVLADLHDVATEHDRLFPLSLGAEGSCMIGGNIATNAGGVQVLRYGNTRDLVMGLQVVLPDGRVWDGLRGLRKDNTGYDLKQLFIGSEGTLGIITAATLRLFPRPRQKATALLGLPSIEAVMALFVKARAITGDQLTAFELLPRIGLEMSVKHLPGLRDPMEQAYPAYALVEMTSPSIGTNLSLALETLLEEALEAGLVLDGVIAASETQALDFWRIREGLPEAQKHEGGSIKHDVSVPISAVAAFIHRATTAVERAMPGVRPVPFGHVGDGNIHYNLSQPIGADRQAFLDRWFEMNHIVHDIVVNEFGGSISAEHGIGRLKRDELIRYKAPIELELMSKIKRAIDPVGLMNPGKVIPAGF